MTWTFTDSLPTGKDRVRAMVGDVDTTAQLKSDELIAAVLVRQPVETLAASAVARMIAADFARKVSMSSGRTRVELQQQYQQYQDLAAALASGGAGYLPGGDGSGVPTLGAWAGGTSFAEQDAMLSDTDKIQPSFSVGMDDHPTKPPDASPPRGWWRW